MKTEKTRLNERSMLEEVKDMMKVINDWMWRSVYLSQDKEAYSNTIIKQGDVEVILE